jgi:hypothetical protein
MSDRSPVVAFLMGMSRSGTTFLMNSLNQHPDLVCFGESLYWGREFIDPGPDGNYSPKQVSSILSSALERNWGPNPFPDSGPTIAGSQEPLATALKIAFDPLLSHGGTPQDVFDAIASAFCQVCEKGSAIEKTPHHVNFIDRIQNRYPDAKFIVTQRDPYEFMLSYKYQGGQTNEQVRDLFRRVYHPFLCAIVCRRYMQSFATLMDSEAQIKSIQLTQIRSDAPKVLEEIEDFLGVEKGHMGVKIAPSNSSFAYEQDRPTLSPVDVFWMNLVCGKHFAALNIMRQESSVPALEVMKSIIHLPITMFHIFRHLLPRHGNQLRHMFRLLR